jgi:hypothetical protein
LQPRYGYAGNRGDGGRQPGSGSDH